MTIVACCLTRSYLDYAVVQHFWRKVDEIFQGTALGSLFSTFAVQRKIKMMKTPHVTHIISYCYSNHGSLVIAISDYSSVELQLKEKQIYKKITYCI